MMLQRGVRRFFFYTAYGNILKTAIPINMMKSRSLLQYKKMPAAEHKLRRASQPRVLERVAYISF